MNSKYHNRTVVQDGAVFDSVKEHRRWCELKVLERAGKIRDLRRQVDFELIPPQREPDAVGKRGGVKKGRIIERACIYRADFVYLENGQTVVEDAKGVRTKDYKIKKKLMLYVHGIRIKET